MADTPAGERLRSITGSGGSPEVPAEILSRDLTILGGGQVGLRINKYGVSGIDLLVKWLAGYAGTAKPTLEKYSSLIARGVASGISVAALLLLTGRTSRVLAFGATWDNLTAGVDWLEETARKAIGV